MAAREAVRVRPVRFLLAGSLALLVLALAGWSEAARPSSNGEASKTPDQIIADVKAAVAQAKDAHIFGSGTSDRSKLTLDLHLVAGKGGKGRITTGALGFEIVRIGGRAYFQGDKAFLTHYAGKTAAELFLHTWFFASSRKGPFASFTPLTSLVKLTDSIFSDYGKLALGPPTTIHGRPAIALVDTTKGGTLYIAATGKPYPLELAGGKGDSGSISFQDWDRPVTLAAPKRAIDYAKLVSGK
jgi:hypothetical protein